MSAAVNPSSAGLAPWLVTMGGSLAFSFYVVLGKKVARKYDSLEMNYYNYTAAAVMILPVTLRQGLLFDWQAVSLQGWTLTREGGPSYAFGDVPLFPGGSVRVHSANGSDTSIDLFWGRPEAVWQSGSVVQ